MLERTCSAVLDISEAFYTKPVCFSLLNKNMPNKYYWKRKWSNTNPYVRRVRSGSRSDTDCAVPNSEIFQNHEDEINQGIIKTKKDIDRKQSEKSSLEFQTGKWGEK